MFKKLALTLALIFGLTACGGMPQNQQQTVFEIKSSYGVALNVAANYAELPACTASRGQPCSDPQAVAQLKKAEPAARATLDAAENAVRTPGFGNNVVNSSITAAREALKAFSVIVTQYAKPAVNASNPPAAK
jgi:starvation-inducible outer membrane lipoprotein